MRIFALHLGANDWHITVELRKRMDFFKQTGKPRTDGGLRNPMYYRVVCFGPFIILWYKDDDLKQDIEDRMYPYE